MIVPADVAWNRELEAAGAKRTVIGCALVALAILLLFTWCYNDIGSTSTPSAPSIARRSAAGVYVVYGADDDNAVLAASAARGESP